MDTGTPPRQLRPPGGFAPSQFGQAPRPATTVRPATRQQFDPSRVPRKQGSMWDSLKTVFTPGPISGSVPRPPQKK
jgi:hypothetical protein